MGSAPTSKPVVFTLPPEKRNQLLLSGLSKQLGANVVIGTPSGNQQTIQFADYSAILHGIPSVDNLKGEEDTFVEEKKIDYESTQFTCKVNVRTLNGVHKIIDCALSSTIRDIKVSIEAQLNIPVAEQRLVFAGKALDDHLTVEETNIHKETTIHLIRIKSQESTDKITVEKSNMRESKKNNEPTLLYFNGDDMLDPEYDYEFPNVTVDDKDHYRGGKLYRRPLGCLRYALKVLGRYDNDWWLNDKNIEWPVSYHTSGKNFLPDKVDKGDGQVYVSPDYKLALDAAEKFEFEGQEYKLFYQDRVNPANLKELQTSKGEYWALPSGNDIRPYAICVKKL